MAIPASCCGNSQDLRSSYLTTSNMDDIEWDEGTMDWVMRKKARIEENTSSLSSGSLFLSIKFSDIPEYLHDSVFYKGLNSDEDNEDVHIPERCYSADDKVQSFPDLLRMLEVMSFWSVVSFPTGVIEFCQSCDREALFNILDNVIDEVAFLSELKRIFCSFGEDSLMCAIKCGRTEVVAYLASKQFQVESPDYITLAADLGKLAYIELLHLHGYAWDETACEKAAEQGHLDCLMYLHENGCDWDYEVYIEAAHYDHAHCFYYAAEQGLPFDVEVLSFLAYFNKADLLRFAIDHGCPLQAFVVHEAAQKGCTDCLNVLLSAGCPVQQDSCLAATTGGHLQCLQLLHEYGAYWDKRVATAAATGNFLHCLQYLHERGCPWDKKTTEGAAKNGHLSCLRFAMEHGCPYPEDIVVITAGSVLSDTMACLRYLVEEQGLFMGEDGKAFITAIHNCKPERVQYLIDQGYSINDCTLEAQDIFQSSVGNDAMLYWGTIYGPESDEPLLQCLKIALDHGWDINENGFEFMKNVIRNKVSLPRSHAYLEAEGCLVNCIVEDYELDLFMYSQI